MQQRNSSSQDYSCSWQYRVRRMTLRDIPHLARMWRAQYPMPPDVERALPHILARMLERHYVVGAVAERLRAPGRSWELAAIGIGGFLGDALSRRYAAEPFPFLGMHVLGEVQAGRAQDVLLPRSEVVRRHRQPPPRLDYFVLCWLQDNYDPTQADTRNLFMMGLQVMERYVSGHRLRKLIMEGRVRHEPAFRCTGFAQLLDFTDTPPSPALASLKEDPRYMPILHGVHTVEDSWNRLWLDPLSRLFNFNEPVLALTDRQKIVLDLALEGYSDQAIARLLGISANAVHMRWRGIYEKAAPVLPELATVSEENETGRGSEKRRLVVQYIRDHLQEIRPWVHVPRG